MDTEVGAVVSEVNANVEDITTQLDRIANRSPFFHQVRRAGCHSLEYSILRTKLTYPYPFFHQVLAMKEILLALGVCLGPVFGTLGTQSPRRPLLLLLLPSLSGAAVAAVLFWPLN